MVPRHANVDHVPADADDLPRHWHHHMEKARRFARSIRAHDTIAAYHVSVPADLRADRPDQRHRERKARSSGRRRHIDGLPDVHNRIGKIDRANRRGLAKRGAAAGVADL
jgi:hypothetical protein